MFQPVIPIARGWIAGVHASVTVRVKKKMLAVKSWEGAPPLATLCAEPTTTLHSRSHPLAAFPLASRVLVHSGKARTGKPRSRPSITLRALRNFELEIIRLSQGGCWRGRDEMAGTRKKSTRKPKAKAQQKDRSPPADDVEVVEETGAVESVVKAAAEFVEEMTSTNPEVLVPRDEAPAAEAKAVVMEVDEEEGVQEAPEVKEKEVEGPPLSMEDRKKKLELLRKRMVSCRSKRFSSCLRRPILTSFFVYAFHSKTPLDKIEPP